MTKRLANLLVETLQAAGVKRCYGIVGDTLNRIAHAIDTERPTDCAGPCGPGSLYFINGLYFRASKF
jgi:pyruvate dehydrogenase (quinone)